MKKVITGFLLVAVMSILVACGEKKDERTISTFADAYIEQGVEVDLEEKPFFSMIGAVDGIIFYMDGNKVAIYQYEDAKAVEEAKKNYGDQMKDWPVNGKFILESSNEQAQEIFKGVAQ